MDSDHCRSCDALLAEGAEWCNLCFTPVALPEELRVASVEAEQPLIEDAEALAAQLPGPSASDTLKPADTPEVAEPTDPRLVWACPACAEENPLDRNVCSVCGTPFGKLFEEDSEVPTIEPGRASMLGLVPGLGLFKLGRGLEGFVRALTAVLALIMMLLFVGSGGGAARIVILILYILFLGFAVAESSVSSRRIAEGGRMLLTGRQVMYVFAAVFGLSVALVVVLAIVVGPQQPVLPPV